MSGLKSMGSLVRGEQIEHDVAFICGAAKRVVAGADDASGSQSALSLDVQKSNEMV